MKCVKTEGPENSGTGHCSGKLHCLAQAFPVPVLHWAGPWSVEVLSSVRDARERELVQQGLELFVFLSFSGTTSLSSCPLNPCLGHLHQSLKPSALPSSPLQSCRLWDALFLWGYLAKDSSGGLLGEVGLARDAQSGWRCWCSGCLIQIFFIYFPSTLTMLFHHSEGDILKYLWRACMLWWQMTWGDGGGGERGCK